MAERAWDKLHDYQIKALSEGADMRFVPNGMLSVTEKRARDYVKESPNNRRLLPIGFDHPSVVASIANVATSITNTSAGRASEVSTRYIPTEVWTVGSSGTLTRGLQQAWSDASFHCVAVGHKGDYGRAKLYQCKIPFNKPAKVIPPFPSAITYDAKAWQFIKEHASKGALFWNVGS